MTTETDYVPDPDKIMSRRPRPAAPRLRPLPHPPLARRRLRRQGRPRPRLRPQGRGEDGGVPELHPERPAPRAPRHPRQQRDTLPLRRGGRRADGQQGPRPGAVPPRHHGRAQPHNLPHVLPRHLRRLRGAHHDDNVGPRRQGPLHRPRREDRRARGSPSPTSSPGASGTTCRET